MDGALAAPSELGKNLVAEEETCEYDPDAIQVCDLTSAATAEVV